MALTSDGHTALHVVAGVPPKHPFIDLDATVQVLVTATKGEVLMKKTPMPHIFSPDKLDKHMCNLVPLQVAVTAAQGYPLDKLHLIAPSCYPDLNDRTLLWDLCIVASRSAEAAEQLAVYATDPAKAGGARDIFKDIMKLDQVLEAVEEDNGGTGTGGSTYPSREGNRSATDLHGCIALLLYTAPKAAVCVLDSLFVEPVIECPAEHCVPTFISFFGFPHNFDMLCHYKSDVVEQGGLFRPAWKYDFSSSTNRWPAWHDEVVERGDARIFVLRHFGQGAEAKESAQTTTGKCHSSMDRHNYVRECAVKVMCVPNVLDMDIMFALSVLLETDYKLFSKLSVQGIINGMWQEMNFKTYRADMFLRFIDTGALVMWGLVGTASWNVHTGQTADANESLVDILCFVLLAATSVRELLMLFSWFYTYAQTSCQYRGAQHLATNHDDESREVIKRYNSLWGFKQLFWYSTFPTEVVAWVLLVLLLYCHPHAISKEVTKDNANAVVLLTVNIVARFYSVVYLFRNIEASGKSYTAVMKTVMRGTVIQIGVIAFVFFVSMYCVFMTLMRHSSWEFIFVFLYRGLLFGDGDALEHLHMSATCYETNSCKITYHGQALHDFALLCLGMMGTFLFTVVIINLIIAVYSNEYELMDNESTRFFMRERAAVNCKYNMELDRFKTKSPWVKMAWMSMVGCPFVIALLLTSIRAYWSGPVVLKDWQDVINYTLGIVLGVGELLLQVWVRQDSSDPDGASTPKYLWVWHESNFNEDYEGDQPAVKGDLDDLVPGKAMNDFTEEMRAERQNAVKKRRAGGVASSLQKANQQVLKLQHDIAEMKQQTRALDKAWEASVEAEVDRMMQEAKPQD
eukprot:NODE_268_length_3256_cov_11.070949.p1 GENE.NODE_268_length_3256_cov_11.070949~~NODE_268_length_3256_cov_11.070949.p1  ORF type:complete len:971 (+),score=222.21 NODE_268_length_3256_cov_11.070949:349-2913(+)